MEYKEMKVAELKSLCAERGIAFPAKATKAQLVGWLEAADLNAPIEVEAVTVDDEIIPADALAVDIEGMRVAAVALTEAMDEAATAIGEYDVDDGVIGGMTVSDIRVCEDGLAAAFNDVEGRRKELTRMLTEPKKAIDAEVKKLTVPLKELAQRYADARQDLYEKGYRAQYEDCCIANGLDDLPQVVPYERFVSGHKQWLSRTANPAKTQEKIADEVARIAHDLQSLRKLRGSMAFYDDAEACFYETLDLNAAIARNEERTRQQEAVERMRRQEEENERWRAEQAKEAPEPAWTPEFVEVEPEPAPTPEPSAEAARAPQGRPDGRRRYHFEAWMTDAELASFREWKNVCRIGEGWTFREVRNG